jgi:thioredoxin reductase (NADPH)
MGHGVSTCATCDGYFFRDKPIAVVGGGDSAMEEATFLTKFAGKVLVVHRRDRLRASQAMQQRAFDNDKISFLWNREVADIRGEGRVESVVLRDTASGRTESLEAGAVFVAIGHAPNTGLFRGHLDLDPDGYVVVNGTQTSVPGVFAAGDVHDRRYRQAVTAAGFGCQAAIDTDRYLSEGGPGGDSDNGLGI